MFHILSERKKQTEETEKKVQQINNDITKIISLSQENQIHKIIYEL